MPRPFKIASDSARSVILAKGLDDVNMKLLLVVMIDNQDVARENQDKTNVILEGVSANQDELKAELTHLHECVEARFPLRRNRKKIAAAGTGGAVGIGGIAWAIWEFIKPIFTR